ncbi:hypothetical protein EVAR_29356_1 [Eumeta japonica]|uniref:Uncharacterized protein n=1 Tax=Eumeta variegata TaxID=151549 RepID=A0A4C1WKC2_EUMVA|nr:hypothetical protein EVAR_29356_1 [Eumeta japonica]
MEFKRLRKSRTGPCDKSCSLEGSVDIIESKDDIAHGALRAQPARAPRHVPTLRNIGRRNKTPAKTQSPAAISNVFNTADLNIRPRTPHRRRVRSDAVDEERPAGRVAERLSHTYTQPQKSNQCASLIGRDKSDEGENGLMERAVGHWNSYSLGGNQQRKLLLYNKFSNTECRRTHLSPRFDLCRRYFVLHGTGLNLGCHMA